MRIALWVRPRSRRCGVGGERDGALVVRVIEPPEDGRATEAALSALAGALGVRRNAVDLVSGLTSRTKVVEVVGDERVLGAAVDRLRGAATTPSSARP